VHLIVIETSYLGLHRKLVNGFGKRNGQGWESSITKGFLKKAAVALYQNTGVILVVYFTL